MTKLENNFMKLTVEDFKDVGDTMGMASDITVTCLEDREAWAAGILALAKKLGCESSEKHVQIASVQLADTFVKYFRTCEKYCGKK